VSYLNGNVVKRGTPGSVRVDAVIGPEDNQIFVVDLKTGNSKLTPQRVRKLRLHVKMGKTFLWLASLHRSGEDLVYEKVKDQALREKMAVAAAEWLDAQ
jgi:hypothetical protein